MTKRLNRKQVIQKKRDELIAQADRDEGDFLVEEIAEMFRLTKGRVSQILKAENNKK